MLPLLAPAIISSLGSLAGGYLNSQATQAANAANLAFQARNAARNRRMQMRAAHHQLEWKARDARRAGVSRHFAMGAPTLSMSPSSVGSPITPDTAMGNALANSSQEIGRALAAGQTQNERMLTRTDAQMTALQLERAGLENTLLRVQIMKNAQQTPPPVPSPGQSWLIPGLVPAPGAGITDQPMKRTASDPAQPWQEPGAISDVGAARTQYGIYPVPGSDVKQRIEDNFWHESMHFLRNNLLPTISPYFNNPPYAAAPGKEWVYSPVYGYRQSDTDRPWYKKFIRAD